MAARLAAAGDERGRRAGAPGGRRGHRRDETQWGWVEVAPGLRWAAVLEKDLPVRRIGIFDMETRRVRAWVPVDHPVGGLAWSPDGTRLLATAYDESPDLAARSVVTERQCPTRAAVSPEGMRHPPFQTISTSRTGFHVVDVATATAGDFHAVDPCRTENSNVRRDFSWSDDGTLVREAGNIRKRPDSFYDLEGRPHDAPAGYVVAESRAGVSPDGTLLAGPDGSPTEVTELSTGKSWAASRCSSSSPGPTITAWWRWAARTGAAASSATAWSW